jgi:heme a synthase
LVFSWKLYQQQSRLATPSSSVKNGIVALLLALTTQVLLGIFTLIACKGGIPVTLGVLHQAGAVVLLTCVLYVTYQLKAERG